MVDPQSKNLLHVILTAADLENAESLDGLEQGGLPLDVVHIEAIGPERAQQLTEQLARMSAGEGSGHQHGAGVGSEPCAICSPLQRVLVGDAVRRALWDAAEPFPE